MIVPSQLSVADGTVSVTEQSPFTAASTGAIGAVASKTVIVKLQLVTLPEASVAV